MGIHTLVIPVFLFSIVFLGGGDFPPFQKAMGGRGGVSHFSHGLVLLFAISPLG